MAQKFMSPGVFTSETDLSFLAQGVSGIGAAVIGRSLKGPAMVPTIVQGFDDFVAQFGNQTTTMQMPYAVKNYLKNSAQMTVVRVLGHADGLSANNGWLISKISGISDGASILAVVHSSGTLAISGIPLDANNFGVLITSPVYFSATASFLTSSANYIEKVLNQDPTKFSTYGHYVYRNFSYAKPAVSASWSSVGISASSNTFYSDFSAGITAWVKSQPLGGNEFNLFRFRTRSHGVTTTNDLKVTIQNVKTSPNPTVSGYGTFDVIVRQFGDTDQRQVVLESFIGCTLNPNSSNFVLSRIGDKVETFDTTQRKFVQTGNWDNKSRNVTVELDTTANPPPEALPWGHRGYTKEQFSGSLSASSLQYAVNLLDRNGNVDVNNCWGITLLSGGVEDRMRVAPDSTVQASDTDFSLNFMSASYVNGRQFWSYVPSLGSNQYHSPVQSSASLYKFNLPFQGGGDGFDIRVIDPLYLNNTDDDTVIGVVSSKRSLDTVANPDFVDMNLLAVPGVHNIKVTDKARGIVNDRGDALFIMDITGSSVQESIGQLSARQIDDNYTAAYYPDLRLKDSINNRIVRVSPSVAILGAMAYSDRVAQPWFAAAGLNRGGLGQFNINDVCDRLTFQDRNDLYDNRINPIATFPKEGIVVFGQKTLQVKSSALDRVNVRRLLIFAKKTVAAAAKLLLFDPNDAQNWEKFMKAVNPIFENIRQNRGVNRFKVVMDTTTNTPDLIDRNIMTGKIFLEPTRAGEFIDISFVITAAGVSFGE